MRVLQVFIGGDSYGGVENFLNQYSKQIESTDCQFDFAYCVANSLNGREECKMLLDANYFDLGMKKSYPKIIKYYSVYKNLQKQLRRGKYECIHVHTGNVFIQLACMKAARKAGIRTRVAHSHSKLQVKKRSLLELLIRRACCSLVYRWSTARLTCSREAASSIFGDYSTQADVVLFPNAIDLEEYKFDEETRKEYRKKFGLSGKTALIQVGNFLPVKNHMFTVELLADMRKRGNDCVLLLAGSGELVDDVKESVSHHGLEDNVLFLGNRSDVSKLLQAADCMVMPSIWEGLPYAAIEAQASGIRVVCSTNVPGETRVLDTCVFVPLELNAWVRECQKRVDNRGEAYETMKSSKFNIANSAVELLKIYAMSTNNASGNLAMNA